MPAPTADNPAVRRDHLADSTERVLRPASGAKPAILLVRIGGRQAIVKDFSRNAWLLRNIYGRWIVAHESRIYSHLDGVEGVPAFRGRLDAFAFATDFVGGRTLKALRRRSLGSEVFDRLAALHRALHSRGVVHLDSHQKRNILLAADGQPCLVDFATALYLGSGWLSRRVLVPLFAWADRLGLHKLKVRYCADAPKPAEARRGRLLYAIGWLWPYTAGRRLRRIWRRRRGGQANTQGDDDAEG